MSSEWDEEDPEFEPATVCLDCGEVTEDCFCSEVDEAENREESALHHGSLHDVLGTSLDRWDRHEDYK